MNKQNLIIIILAAFALTVAAAGFAQAQVPDVPAPTCVSVPGIPCPGESDTAASPAGQPAEPAEKATPDITQSISDLFNYLAANINRIINDITQGFRNIYDGFRDQFKIF